MKCTGNIEFGGEIFPVEFNNLKGQQEANKIANEIVQSLMNQDKAKFELLTQNEELYDIIYKKISEKLDENIQSNNGVSELSKNADEESIPLIASTPVIKSSIKYKDLTEELLPAQIKSKLQRLADAFGGTINPELDIMSIDEDISYYDAEKGFIAISKKDKSRQSLIHELVHHIVDSKFNPGDENVNSIYKTISVKLKQAKNPENKDLNINQQIKEYLAEFYTSQIQNTKTALNIGLSKDLISRYFSANESEQTSNDKSFFRHLYSDAFSEDAIITDRELAILSNVKFKDILDNKEAQDILERVYTTYADNKEVKDFAAYSTNHNLSDNTHANLVKISRLSGGDLILLPESTSKSGDKFHQRYVPVLKTYYSKKDRVIKVQYISKTSDGYRIFSINADQIKDYREGFGEIKTSVSKTKIDKLTSKFKEDQAFIEHGSSKSESKKGDLVTYYYKKASPGAKGWMISRANIGAVRLQLNHNTDKKEEVIRNLSEGSIIEFKITDSKTKKLTTLRAPVLRVLGSAIECVGTKSGSTYVVPFYKVDAIVTMLDDLQNDEFLDKIDDVTTYNKDNSKSIGRTVFKITNEKGEFKKVPSSKYDYAQIYRKEVAGIISEFMTDNKSLYKDGEFDKEAFSKLPKSVEKDIFQVYLNRKQLLSSLNYTNAYAQFEYIGKEGKSKIGKGKVINTTDNTITLMCYKKDGSPYTITSNIRQASAEEFKPAIRRFYYDNSEAYSLASMLSSAKENLSNNYSAMSDLYNGKNTITQRLVEDSTNTIEEVEHDLTRVPTQMTDLYHYEYNDDSQNRMFLLSQLNVGDIVLVGLPTLNVFKVITKINKGTGEIFASNIINSNTKYDGNLATIKIDEKTDIKLFGFSIYDTEFSNKNETFAKKDYMFQKRLQESNKYKMFNSEKAANSFIRNSNESVVELQEITNGNDSFYAPELTKNMSKAGYEIGKGIKYGIKKSYGKSEWIARSREYMLNADFDKLTNTSDKNKLFNIIEEGDIIYSNKYSYIVTNKIQTKDSVKYKVEKAYTDKNGDTKRIVKYFTKNQIKDIGSVYYNAKKETDKYNVISSFFNTSKKSLSKDDFKVTINVDNHLGFSKETSGYNKSIDHFVYINALSKRLASAYGIDFKLLTSDEIASAYDGDILFSNKRAFVLGNEIVINSDLASIAEPLHELTHIILPQLKNMDAPLYKELMNKVQSHPDYNAIANNYPELSGMELNEEVFCTVFGEHYAKKYRSNEGIEWNNDNKSWFFKTINAIKSFFKDLFGLGNELDDYSEERLMKTSLEVLMNKYGDNLIKGDFVNLIPMHNERFNLKIDTMIKMLYDKKLINKECYG